MVREAVEDLVDPLTVQYSFPIYIGVHHIAREKKVLSPASLITSTANFAVTYDARSFRGRPAFDQL